jgi:predicted TIM-barrel fold metal-dependent hydrolase
MIRTLRTLAAGGALLIAAAGPALAQAAPPATMAIGDYHMHVQGPAVTANLGRAKAKEPEFFAMLPDLMLHERSGRQALAALDASGIHEGTLLSAAYMISSKMLALPAADIARLTRAENRFNVEAAAASHGRLQAFISVNPLATGAMDELAYWRGRPGVDGLKLHLANAGFDPGSATDVAKLAAIFAFADRAALPIVIHTRTKKSWGTDDVRSLIDKVLPQADHVPVQIAHCDTWIGVDQAALDSLRLYAEAIEHHAKGTEHLSFDLSGLFLNDKNDPVMLQAFVAAMRRIGLHRFVLGSDWPVFVKPADYYALLRSQLPLTAPEWDALSRNEAPYFQHRRASK